MKYLIILLSCFLLLIILIQFSLMGFFIKADTPLNVSDMEVLKSLPYVSSWAPIKEEDREKMGVVKYDPNSSYKGINFYYSWSSNSIYLMDMQGKIIHKWTINPDNWGDATAINKNGELFFIAQDKMLAKIDWNSKLIWENKLRFHHYINLAENGDIYSLTRRRVELLYKGRLIPVLDDYITILSSSGEAKTELSIFKLVGREIPESRLDKILEIIRNNDVAKIAQEEDTPIDLFHTNSVEVINRDVNGLCKKGDILISLRELNLIAIVDLKKEKVIWNWGQNDLDGQHSPSLLENGNILIFDNGRYKRKYSRIIELNPITKKIEWEYKATPLSSFYTDSGGFSQKLPNGNVLIVETNRGRAFEITGDGEIVWEFYNPEILRGQRAGIINMVRLSPDKLIIMQRGNKISDSLLKTTGAF